MTFQAYISIEHCTQQRVEGKGDPDTLLVLRALGEVSLTQTRLIGTSGMAGGASTVGLSPGEDLSVKDDNVTPLLIQFALLDAQEILFLALGLSETWSNEDTREARVLTDQRGFGQEDALEVTAR